ncbi:MAG: carboxymuconolactone decarboxylase family protein [Pseudomonadales bacterium]
MTHAETSYPNRLSHLKSLIPELTRGQSEVMQGFGALHAAATKDGALDKKTKELIALAIAVASQCDGCIAFHTHDALHAGATEAEVMDTLGVAILMGGGPAMVYAAHAAEALADFTAT